MGPKHVVTAWGKILLGRTPNLSIEITRECPLRCPGCYAYGDEHLGGELTLREVSDFKGQALVDGIMGLIDRHRPLHVSLVGGEPLVRHRELDIVLPRLSARGVHTQVVTSAVRPLPLGWREIPRLNISVSVDGLAPEHDARRAPATYERILKHIDGHAVTIHCTVTRQQVQREGYLAEFVDFWSRQPSVKQIWMSLYTPQVGEVSPERLLPEDRQRAVDELVGLLPQCPKLKMPRGLLVAYIQPPSDPDDCIFARTTTSLSADLERRITPCQFGGTPDCAECGCMASAGLAAVGRHRLVGPLQVGTIFEVSERVGRVVAAIRGAVGRDRGPSAGRSPAVQPASVAPLTVVAARSDATSAD